MLISFQTRVLPVRTENGSWWRLGKLIWWRKLWWFSVVRYVATASGFAAAAVERGEAADGVGATGGGALMRDLGG